MNQAYKKILLAVDPQVEALASFETAAILARRHGASITVFDTVRLPSRSGIFFAPNSTEVFEMVIADKQKRIKQIAQRFQEMGLMAEGKLLYGRSSEAITREVIAQDASLLIRHMKGLESRFPGNYGNTARNLMRICPCPILFVGPQPLEDPKVLACINPEHDVRENQSILEAANNLVTKQSNVLSLFCWSVSGQSYLEHYLPEGLYQDTERETERIYQSMLDDFCDKHRNLVAKNRLLFERGQPSCVIPEICDKEQIDIVVMSSASQSHPLRRLLGSTIESVLDDLPCALLVVKQLGFTSPIKTNENQETESMVVTSV